MKQYLITAMVAVAMLAGPALGAMAEDITKIVFVAGKRSHGWDAHEHKAGCMLLADRINKNVPNVAAVVTTEGWPENNTIFDGAAAVVVYCDGGENHVLNPHLDEFDSLAKKGVGLVCLHYGVEVPTGPSGDKFLDWIGGFFETHWSVNPHWTAEFKSLPDHPITNGVNPFSINDEWYYHMRFPEGMKNVSPILSAYPPKETMSRDDGPHSGNPHVRKAVANGEIQHVAWAIERPDGGRGFGFTGGHYHHNWADDDFRKLALNAICWAAKIDVPKDGVPSRTPSNREMDANQDYPKPKKK